ncbi:hypothetical protein ACIA8G_35440 [Lentzea sp. NPDC051213]|uniref:hypothetical protein n=1 Tax=Lentzea sp. NPDC051213 TaxID=3364126 RepID=UPI0037B27400
MSVFTPEHGGVVWTALGIMEQALAPLVDQEMCKVFGTTGWFGRFKEIRDSGIYGSGRLNKGDLTLSLRILADPAYLACSVGRDLRSELLVNLVAARNAWAHASKRKGLEYAKETLEWGNELLRKLGFASEAEKVQHLRESLDGNVKDALVMPQQSLAGAVSAPPVSGDLRARLHGLTQVWAQDVSQFFDESVRLSFAGEVLALVDQCAMRGYSSRDGSSPGWVQRSGWFFPPALEWNEHFVLLEGVDNHAEAAERALTVRAPSHGGVILQAAMPLETMYIDREPRGWRIKGDSFTIAASSLTRVSDDPWTLDLTRDGRLTNMLDPTWRKRMPSVGRGHEIIGKRGHRLAVLTTGPDSVAIIDLVSGKCWWSRGSRDKFVLHDDGHIALEEHVISRFTLNGRRLWIATAECSRLLGVYGQTLLAGDAHKNLMGFSIQNPDVHWIEIARGDRGVRYTAGNGLIASWDSTVCRIRDWGNGAELATIGYRGGIADVQVISGARLAVLFRPAILAVLALNRRAHDFIDLSV